MPELQNGSKGFKSELTPLRVQCYNAEMDVWSEKEISNLKPT